MFKGKASHLQVHFIGIGGIGMSALARWFLAPSTNVEGLAKKWLVSGCDIAFSEIIRGLQKGGVKVKIGHKKRHISKGVSLAVYSQAIPSNNPELIQARKLKITTVSYPQMIGFLTRVYTTIAVSGAHGKSTTTALAGLLLKRAGLDPTIVIGTKLRELKNSNFRNGRSRYLILEADEYGRAFLHYSPTFTIITNLDREHLDTYRNLTGVKNGFLKFISRTKPGGTLILNNDDKNLISIKSKIKKIAAAKNLKIVWYSRRSAGAKKIRSVIKIPGQHNISNALAVTALAKIIEIPERSVLQTIASYRGAWRRAEYRGRYHGALVFDDYAHHPTEIKATLQGFKEKYPNKKIVCVFQPHQAKRLKELFRDFQTAFDLAHETLILPLYQVAGRDKIVKRFSSEALVQAIQKRHQKKLIFYLADPKNLPLALEALAKTAPLKRKIILMMGAGDIVEYTPLLVNKKKAPSLER